MTNEKKKEKLKELKRLLNKAWNISNDLTGEEESYSDNQNHLQNVREEIEASKMSASFVKF